MVESYYEKEADIPGGETFIQISVQLFLAMLRSVIF